MKIPWRFFLALAFSSVAHGGLIVDGVRWEPLSNAAYLTVSNFVAGNYYEKQRGTLILPGYLSLYYNMNETVSFDYSGVRLERAYQLPYVLDFPWPLESGRLVTEQSYQYPVFKFDLGEHWTDFEIKATTNGYAVEGNSGSNLVYYYASWTADQHWSNPDTNAWAYYTDDYADDPRVWIRKGLTNSIADQLANTGSVVCAVYFFPSRDLPNGSDWMRKDNTNLVWSWMRVTDGEYEKRLDGTKTRWRPIRPESWESGRTTP